MNLLLFLVSTSFELENQNDLFQHNANHLYTKAPSKTIHNSKTAEHF